MRNLKTIENRVLAVLKEHPEARNDDMKLYLLISKLRLLFSNLIFLHADTGHGVDDLRIQVIDLLLHQILLILQGIDLAVDVIQLVLMIVDAVLQFVHRRCRLHRLRRGFPDRAGGCQRHRCQKKIT